MHKFFEYKSDGTLVRKARPESDFKTKGAFHTFHTRFAGKPSGCECKITGYILVGIGKKLELAHRVIWQMHFGEIPQDMVIDHINQNKKDNRIENLRLASKSQNALNSKISKNNKSGHKHISFHEKRNKWVLQLKVKDRKILKEFKNIDDAIKLRDDLIKEMHGEFASSIA